MAGIGDNSLRAVLKELGWSRTKLVAEMRRHSGGAALPKTESLITLVSRWVNNHQQPEDFYRDLLAKALARPRTELFSDEATRAELATDAEPWLLARALELSSVGEASLTAPEQAVSGLARSYPSTPPRSSPVLCLSISGTWRTCWTAPCPSPVASGSPSSPATLPAWLAAWRSTCARNPRPTPISRSRCKLPTTPTHPTWRRGRWQPGA
jgi:hypothetical protein